MPNLYGAATAFNGAGYLSPRLNYGAQAAPLSNTQAYSVETSVGVTPQTQSPWWDTLPKIIAAAPVDVLDNIGQIFPGVKEGQVNDAVYEAVGMPQAAQFVREHKDGIDLAAGVLGAVGIGYLTDLAMTKTAASAWFATTGLGKVAAPLIQWTGKAEQAAKQATIAAAANGETLGWMSGANLNLVTSRVVTGVAKAAVSEAAIATVFQKNENIWSEDMSTNLMFGALGLGIGGATGAIEGRALVKRWANSPEVQGEFAKVYDPGKYEQMSTEMPTTGQIAGAMRRDSKPSAIVTSMALNSRYDDALPTQTRTAVKTQTEGKLREVLTQIARKGDEALPDSKFSIASGDILHPTLTAEGRHLTEALHDDPTILLGAASLAKTEDLAADLATRAKYIDEMKAATKSDGKGGIIPDAIERSRARVLEAQTAMAIVNKTLMSPAEAKPFLETNLKDMVFKPTAAGPQELAWEGPSGGKFIMNETGKLNKPIDQLTIPDIIGAQEAANRIQNTMIKREMVLTLPKNADFFQKDFAVEFQKRQGTVDLSKSGFNTIHDVRMSSLRDKSARIANMPELGVHERFRLNLPQATSAEKIADPKGTQLRAMVTASEVPGATVADMINMRQGMQKMTQLTQEVNSMNNLEGDFFNFNRSNDGTRSWHSPLLGFYEEPHDAGKWHNFKLQESIAETRAVTLSSLMSARKTAPLTAGVTSTIMQLPETKVLQSVSGLASSQLPGTTHVAGAIASQFLTQAMRNRFTPVLQAAQNIRRVVNRVTEFQINDVLGRIKPYYDQFSQISGKSSKILYAQYLSNSAGWDIRGVEQNADGMFQFILDPQSASNVRRLEHDVAPNELLRNKNGDVIALDPLGNAARMAMEQEYTQLLKERNAVRISRGLDPIKARDFFTPPPNTKGKKVGFSIDSAGRVIPGGAIVADTQGAFDAASKELVARLPPGATFMTREQIKSHADLWERAGLDFIDPTQMAAPAKHQTGKLFSDTVNPNAVEDAIDYLKSGYEQVVNGAVREVFSPQLRIASIRDAAELTTKGQVEGTRSIWKEFEHNLMGTAAGVDPRGTTPIFQALDKKLDAVIGAAWPRMRDAINPRHLGDVLDKVGFKGSLGDVKSFADLSDKLGPYMPFKTAQDYAAFTHKLDTTPTMKDFARFSNRMGAAIVLRWLEIPQAAMNMAGIITNMPGLIGANNVPLLGKVKGVGVIDTARILGQGFKRMVTEGDAGWQRGSADWATMVKNGDASQDAMEIHKQLSLIDSRAKFMKVMTGDPASKTRLGKLGIEGVASYLTDTSESLSRIWAHHVGLELADYHGIVGQEARHTFARQIANDAIANYDPLNRPEIFQSAFGNMYGLFLSYSNNYYQRMFRYIEDKDYKAVGTALSMQASMFGMAGLPGFNQVASLLGGENENKSPLDNIYSKYGPVVGSVVAHGGFNQLITLLGIPAVALNTRGDMNFRNPTLDFIASGQVVAPVGFKALADVGNGIWTAASNMLDPNQPHSAQMVAETLARTMPNRAMKGIISVLGAQGKEIDAYGNMVSENQSVAETVYRMIGIRSARQQAEIEAYFGNKQAVAIDAAKMEKVREATRSMVRSGKMDGLPQVFSSYLDAGGKPWNYPTWIKGMIDDADNTRTANQLQSALRSPSQQGLAQRIRQYTGQ